MIKSATTVYNRGKPRSKRSVQAKRHRGKGLFCTKKPPKAEDVDNESTHYRRAHVKNVKYASFSCEVRVTKRIFALAKGFSNTRNQRILTPTDMDKARAVPKYDSPENLVYQTPEAHRFFSKSSTRSDVGDKKLITEEIVTLYLLDKQLLLHQVGQHELEKLFG